MDPYHLDPDLERDPDPAMTLFTSNDNELGYVYLYRYTVACSKGREGGNTLSLEFDVIFFENTNRRSKKSLEGWA